MEDGAPSHRAAQTIMYLGLNCPDFIEPNLWPPCSPDLNSIDYFVWSQLEKAVYDRTRIRDINQRKERITECWNQLPQGQIASAIGHRRRRLQMVANKNGGYIESYYL
jgi:hypothetical protein